MISKNDQGKLNDLSSLLDTLLIDTSVTNWRGGGSVKTVLFVRVVERGRSRIVVRRHGAVSCAVLEDVSSGEGDEDHAVVQEISQSSVRVFEISGKDKLDQSRKESEPSDDIVGDNRSLILICERDNGSVQRQSEKESTHKLISVRRALRLA